MWSAIISAIVAIAQAGISAGVAKKKEREAMEGAEQELATNIQDAQKQRVELKKQAAEDNITRKQRLEQERIALRDQKADYLDQQKEVETGLRQDVYQSMKSNPTRTVEDLQGKAMRRL